jgi:hypothetical protein
MDVNHRDIPIVEDDMGEGFMDPIEDEETLGDRLMRRHWAAQERAKKHCKAEQNSGWQVVKLTDK